MQCCTEHKFAEPSKPCPHLAAFKTTSGGLTDNFHCVVQLLYTAQLRLIKLAPFRCSFKGCGELTGRLHICTHCVWVSCWDGRHVHEHRNATNHILFVDISHMQLYCFGCHDYIYDFDFEHVVQCERAQAIAYKQTFIVPSEKRAIYKEWTAGEQEANLLIKESKKYTHQPSNNPPAKRSKRTIDGESQIASMADIAPPAPVLIGLRGLINLGNTCFMNTILQSFLHNPLMRNYFLSDFHNRAHCKRQHHTFQNAEGSSQRSYEVCLACELDSIFSQFFSPISAYNLLNNNSTVQNSVNSTKPSQSYTPPTDMPVNASHSYSICPPFAPHHFLYGIWKQNESLAGYEQQDAHEFLISALNGIHCHSGGTMQDCRCIVHRIFAGELCSDVTCCRCSTVSTATDPFFDISLDIPKLRNGDENQACTLFDCLSKFTQQEKLEGKEGFYCNKCRSYQEAYKQLSMKKLPAVICFHLKRFETHMQQNTKTSSKIDTFVAFPEELDMYNYLSYTIKNKKQKPNLPNPGNEIFQLFAVVNHQGKMENGHYTCFVRQHHNLWVKCDDSSITKATVSNVLRSNGYMLFYVRKMLEYEKTDI